MTMIEFKGISKMYVDGEGTNDILKNADWKVECGQLVAIRGRSGSGKSTVLKMILGITKIDSGEILVDGTPVLRDNYGKIRSELVGVVFQNFNLISNLSVRDNILLPTYFHSKALDYEKRMKEILQILEISNTMLDKNVMTLSGGEKQRIAIARAIINGNNILLADEPTGNLDIENEYKVIELFKKLRENYETTIVAVTHSDRLADEMDIVYMIENNKIVYSGRK